MKKEKVRLARTYCDVPMARYKNKLPCIEKDCKNCFCCIVVWENGIAEHVIPGKEKALYE